MDKRGRRWSSIFPGLGVTDESLQAKFVTACASPATKPRSIRSPCTHWGQIQTNSLAPQWDALAIEGHFDVSGYSATIRDSERAQEIWE